MARWKALARGFPTGHLRAPFEVTKFDREVRQSGFRYATKETQICAARDWTWRPQLELGDDPLESHEQGLSNELSMTSIRGHWVRLRNAQSWCLGFGFCLDFGHWLPKHIASAVHHRADAGDDQPTRVSCERLDWRPAGATAPRFAVAQ